MEISAQLIRSKAPLRLSFAGGGTDVRPYVDQEGGCVLNATITRYAWGSLSPRADSQIQIESADFNSLVSFEAREHLVYDGKMDLAKAAIRNLCGQSSAGFDLFLHTDAPPGSGLGSSSSLMVSLVGLFREYQGLPLSDYDTAQLAYSIEREQLGIRGGMQDQYAASFGGFNFTEFYADRVIVNPLRISQDTVNELEHNLLLCYTGKPRAGGGIIDDQVARYEKREEDALTGLRRQRELAFEMKNALLERRLDDFGALLGLAWRYKKKMSPRISTPAIDEMYEVAMRHGAIGGKITGAGAGGYMLFYCRYEKRLRVAEALRAMGATPTEFGFEPRGLQTWRAGERRVYPRPNTGETPSPSWRLVAAHSPS
jgi:D-glycero-alpha-D-manno-heptose-7-phosphate kinase